MVELVEGGKPDFIVKDLTKSVFVFVIVNSQSCFTHSVSVDVVDGGIQLTIDQ